MYALVEIIPIDNQRSVESCDARLKHNVWDCSNLGSTEHVSLKMVIIRIRFIENHHTLSGVSAHFICLLQSTNFYICTCTLGFLQLIGLG